MSGVTVFEVILSVDNWSYLCWVFSSLVAVALSRSQASVVTVGFLVETAFSRLVGSRREWIWAGGKAKRDCGESFRVPTRRQSSGAGDVGGEASAKRLQ